MSGPVVAIVLAVLGGLFLFASAFLGVTAIADWTMFGAEACFALAGVIFLGWFLAGCVSEIRNA